jgi:hypothetical protein
MKVIVGAVVTVAEAVVEEEAAAGEAVSKMMMMEIFNTNTQEEPGEVAKIGNTAVATERVILVVMMISIMMTKRSSHKLQIASISAAVAVVLDEAGIEELVLNREVELHPFAEVIQVGMIIDKRMMMRMSLPSVGTTEEEEAAVAVVVASGEVVKPMTKIVNLSVAVAAVVEVVEVVEAEAVAEEAAADSVLPLLQRVIVHIRKDHSLISSLFLLPIKRSLSKSILLGETKSCQRNTMRQSLIESSRNLMCSTSHSVCSHLRTKSKLRSAGKCCRLLSQRLNN